MWLIDDSFLEDRCKRQKSDEWNKKAAPSSWADAYEQFLTDIENCPTVDAVPVVHATLEDMRLVEDDREWVCSNCKAEFTVCVCGKDRTGYIKHCPYCGAVIIGEHKGGDE